MQLAPALAALTALSLAAGMARGDGAPVVVELFTSQGCSSCPATDALLGELARAEVRDDADMPAGVVGMHSRVECVDEHSGERHELTLVFPQEADVDAGKVSVLAPVGSALLGLSVGQSIDWNTPGGRSLRLRVTAVHAG